MNGEGGGTVDRGCDGSAFELPSVLAQLDGEDPATRRQAVRTIRESIDKEPTRYLPAVPKLRGLLGDSSIDVHDEIAHCLAVFAEQSPPDVAPSVDEIVSFVVEHETHPATTNLLRCLATVATEHPETVADHSAALIDALEMRPEPGQWGLRLLATLSVARPAAIEPAVPLLADALATDPETNGPPALSALGRIVRSDGTAPPLEFVTVARDLVDHDDEAVRNNAIGCLGDVAHHNPAAVEDACPEIARALERDDPNSRANAAVAIARVAAGSEAAVDPARNVLCSLLDDDHARVRTSACLAIGYGGVDEAIDRLQTLASGDPNPTVRKRASWAIDQLTGPAGSQ